MSRQMSRAKALGNLENPWVYGSYLPNLKSNHAVTGEEITTHSMWLWDVEQPSGLTPGTIVSIDPETLGQCTGLTDKNGTLIFEGDVVKVFCDNVLGTFTSVVEWDNGFGVRIPNSELDDSLAYLDKIGETVTVIDNRWDNPEMMVYSLWPTYNKQSVNPTPCTGNTT